jgi:hypothetical protein
MAYLQESSRLRAKTWNSLPVTARPAYPRSVVPDGIALKNPAHPGGRNHICHDTSRRAEGGWCRVFFAGKSPKSKTLYRGMAMEHKLLDLQPRLGAGRQQNFYVNAASAAAAKQAGSRPHSLLFTRFTLAAAAAPTQPESRPRFSVEQALSL